MTEKKNPKKQKPKAKSDEDVYMEQLIEVPVTHPLNDTGVPLKVLNG